MTKITISIVTYNNEDSICRTLDSLFEYWPENLSCHIFVMDNGSKDHTLQKLDGYRDKITLIHSEAGNIGFGAAHNLIIDRLDSEMHIIMNPDIILKDRQSIPVLYNYLAVHEDVGMVVPEITDDQGHIQYLCRRELTVLDLFLRFFPGNLFRKRKEYHTMMDQDYEQPFDVEFASGCLMAVRTSLFKQLNGFDEGYFLYVEDADLTRRINQIFRTVYIPEAVVYHDWQRESYRKPAMTLIHIKSLLYYFRKWGFRFK